MSMTSLDVLTPLPPTAEKGCCSLCAEKRASWAVRGVADVFFCSLCLLYRTPWGEEAALAASSTLILMRHTSKQAYETVDGRLTSCADADNLMGILVLIDRTAKRMPQ